MNTIYNQALSAACRADNDDLIKLLLVHGAEASSVIPPSSFSIIKIATNTCADDTIITDNLRNKDNGMQTRNGPRRQIQLLNDILCRTIIKYRLII